MKTTRALLAALALVLFVAAAVFALLNVSLPVAELFGYGTGGLAVLGLLTMLASSYRPARTLPPPARATEAAPAVRLAARRPSVRRTFAHAA